MARPTIYTKKLGTKICKRIAAGESLRAICRDDAMPSASSVFGWLLDEDKKSFLEQYETARAVQAEIMFEELLEIADDGRNDFVEMVHASAHGLDGDEDEAASTFTKLNTENIQRSRLRVDTRKWYLSKVLPKKFADKQVHASDPDNPVSVVFMPSEIAAKNAIPMNETDTSAK
jgi:hypothetical protein